MTVFKANDNSITSTSVKDDLDLSLVKSSTDEIQISSTSLYNNVEIIEFVVPENGDGEYEYQITCNSINSTNIPAALTWVKWRPGDVNSDGVADNTDALLVSQYDAGLIDLTPEQLFFADVNRDGMVDNTDSLLILQYDSGANVVLQ